MTPPENANQLAPTVFIVDDDAEIRHSVELTLRPLEAATESFESAEDFLDRWEGPRPGCVLLDVRMPGISGIELHRKLAAEHPYLSAVIVTGHATIPMSVGSMKNGAFDFLEKPYRPDELRALMSDALIRAKDAWQQYLLQYEYELLRTELTPREQQVHELLLQGLVNRQIAKELGISPSTAEKHRLAVARKMGIETTGELLNQKFRATGRLADGSASPDIS